MKQLTTAFILFLTALQLVIAQEAPDTLSPTLFREWYTGTDDILDLTIQTDFKGLVNQKYKEEYQDAEISYVGAGGEKIVLNGKVRARGNVRKEVCYYPPIKLKFKKSNLKSSGWEPSNELKLVCQCRNNKINEEYLYKEYMIYKLYNLLTPYSYRAQLARFHFVDPESKKEPPTLIGMIIEPDIDLADRTGGTIIKRTGANPHMMEDRPYQLMGAFEYMIGNTDWSPINLHNLDLLKVPSMTKIIALPYDFDYSGMVDTDYAVPSEGLPLKTVRTRYYTGPNCDDEAAEWLYQFFTEKKDEILNYCQQFPHLDEKSRKIVHGYIEEFFDLLDSPKAAKFMFSR